MARGGFVGTNSGLTILHSTYILLDDNCKRLLAEQSKADLTAWRMGPAQGAGNGRFYLCRLHSWPKLQWQCRLVLPSRAAVEPTGGQSTLTIC